ncbi:NfeD family protein [Salisediminibacterium halotolerans]|uniref:NfeD-like C-terminal, partner-binding n=1 Tax=Salisediminibacterium halotolerans TaxID=517425 RepID=A0A1H9SAF4_9BACI|nr:NfeD family protein [Salisediminibacterium haloalkalitolerans]SER81565.1 NfeD-like C-terminal, partner-binding [Salisediminibacterium haloalkalitolerans]
MEFLDFATVGFAVIFIATLFIFGELFVRTKGAFAAIGILIMALYFSHHISAADGTWIIILYLIGLSLIIFDGQVTADGSIAIFGGLFMIAALAIPSPDWVYGGLVVMAFVLAAPTSYLFTKVFPQRDMWSKIMFKDKLTSEMGYNSMNEDYRDLVGKEGVTKTPFRPTGTVEIDGRLYSATTDNQWVEEDQAVKVIDADGTRILVDIERT